MPQKYETYSRDELTACAEKLNRVAAVVSSVVTQMHLKDIKEIEMLWSASDRAKLHRVLMLAGLVQSAINNKLEQLELGIPDTSIRRKIINDAVKKHRANKKGKK
jgi:hypothetical protein